MLVVSLDRIGSTSGDDDQQRYQARLARFCESWQAGLRLAKARQILSDPFSRRLGPDNMDELERETEDVPFWSLDRPDPPKEILMEFDHTDGS